VQVALITGEVVLKDDRTLSPNTAITNLYTNYLETCYSGFRVLGLNVTRVVFWVVFLTLVVVIMGIIFASQWNIPVWIFGRDNV
jgi:hypothetical protein